MLWLVVDVCDLAPTLTSEIRALPWIDTDGLVKHTLRLQLNNADALRARAVTRFKAGWTNTPGMPPRLKTVRPYPPGAHWIPPAGSAAMSARWGSATTARSMRWPARFTGCCIACWTYCWWKGPQHDRGAHRAIGARPGQTAQ